MSGALRLVATRLGSLLLIALVVAAGCYGLQELAPGDRAITALAGRSSSQEQVDALRAKYGLDASLPERYASWLGDAVRGDLGESQRTGEDVGSVLVRTGRLSALLAGGALLFGLLVGVPLGVLAALRQRTLVDRAAVALGVTGISAPPFVTGLVLIGVLSVMVPLFPATGAGHGFADGLRHLALPIVAASLTVIGLIVKITRAAMIDTLEQEYVTFARSRGLSRRTVVVRYALRAALVPILTSAGSLFAALLGGVTLVEVTFGLPGLGALMVTSVAFSDTPVIVGIVVLIACLVGLVNLLVDLLYRVVDPRMRVRGAVAAAGRS